MNIFELAVVAAFIAAGYFCGKWLGLQYGVVGWIAGFLLGVTFGGSGFIGLRKLLNIWYKCRPLRPICKEGKCSSDDYEIIECLKGRVVFRCQCGTKYLKKGQFFMEILDDGSTIPYMRRNGILGSWIRVPENIQASETKE